MVSQSKLRGYQEELLQAEVEVEEILRWALIQFLRF